MGIINNWLKKLNPAQPAIAASEGDSLPTNITSYKQAYSEIEVIHRSIEICINALAEVPFEVNGGPAKKITKLLNKRPNPFQDRQRFFRGLFLDFYLDGNAFIYYDNTTEGGALYHLPANDMVIVPDPKYFVKRYEYNPIVGSNDIFSSSSQANKGTTAITFNRDEIIHIRNDSDSSIYRGDSKLKNLERLIELYYSMISFQQQFFKNNAVPGFVLSTDNVLSKKVKERLLEDWRVNYTTMFKGARSPAILDGGLKVDPFSNVNFRELDFEASVERLQIDMAKALGVPYVMLKSGNNANIGNNQALFYLHTIIPILDQFASAFQLKFGPDATITPDKLSVAALRPDTKAQALFYSTLVNGGIITPNEARAGLRFVKDEDPESDKIRIPRNIAGSAVDPSKGGRKPNSDTINNS